MLGCGAWNGSDWRSLLLMSILMGLTYKLRTTWYFQFQLLINLFRGIADGTQPEA